VHCPAAGGLDLGHGGAAALLADLTDDDPRAFPREEQGRGPADAGAGPGDHRNLVLKSHGRFSLDGADGVARALGYAYLCTPTTSRKTSP
jgi:hypothetical protein